MLEFQPKEIKTFKKKKQPVRANWLARKVGNENSWSYEHGDPKSREWGSYTWTCLGNEDSWTLAN